MKSRSQRFTENTNSNNEKLFLFGVSNSSFGSFLTGIVVGAGVVWLLLMIVLWIVANGSQVYLVADLEIQNFKFR